MQKKGHLYFSFDFVWYIIYVDVRSEQWGEGVT